MPGSFNKGRKKFVKDKSGVKKNNLSDHNPLAARYYSRNSKTMRDGACRCVNDRKPRDCVRRWVWELKKWSVGQKVPVVLIKQQASFLYLPTPPFKSFNIKAFRFCRFFSSTQLFFACSRFLLLSIQPPALWGLSGPGLILVFVPGPWNERVSG